MVMPYLSQVRMRGKCERGIDGLRLRVGTADRDFDLLEPNRWWRDYREYTRFTLRRIS